MEILAMSRDLPTIDGTYNSHEVCEHEDTARCLPGNPFADWSAHQADGCTQCPWYEHSSATEPCKSCEQLGVLQMPRQPD